MKDGRPILAQYFVEQACPNNKFMEEMEAVRRYVQLLKQKKTKKQDIEVNVNKTDWEFINELPSFDRVKAKKAVWIRRKIGKYTSLDDFFTKNHVDDEYKKILKKLVVIK